MKRNVVLALLLFSVLFLTAGCGSGSTDTKSNGNEIVLAIWDNNQKQGMEEMAAAFTKENPDISVKVRVTPFDQYFTKLETQATGNNLPDVFWMPPEYLPKYVNGDKLLDLTDRIQKDKVDLNDFPENLVKALSKNDKQYAMPKDVSTIGLWYNKKIFDDAGVAYPDDTWDWDKLHKVAKQLTDEKKGIYGCLAPNDGNFYNSLIWQNGGTNINEAGTKATVDTPEVREALEYAYSFIKDGLSPDIASFSSTSPDQYFESGKAAMNFGGSWMAAEYLQVDGAEFDVAPLPKGKQRANSMAGLGFSIAKETKNTDNAWKFVNFMSGKEASIIQAKSGAAIPAHKGTQGYYIEEYSEINSQVFVDAIENGTSQNFVDSFEKWKSIFSDGVGEILSGTAKVDEKTKEMNKGIQAIIDESK